MKDVFVKGALLIYLRTNYVLKTVAFCLLACGLTWAKPPQCKQATLAHYLSLRAAGCQYGNVVFANFEYSSSAKGGAQKITAEQIMVAPLLIPVEAPSFKFSAPWRVAGAQSQDSVISYTAVLPLDDIEPATLSLLLGQAQVGTIGSVSVRESTNVSGEFTDVGELQVFDRCTDVCQTKLEDSFQFNPASLVLFEFQVALDGGSNGASLKGFESQLNLCPPCA